ncbi:hypothetical protein [Sulfobacillus harzensis]|uniref:Uncharacterized protein n=1 Tax=Sulfobacillus harzensis TaxID=2729629 RepID=A0A7Y0L748_9FIRM|nr:hypothetical protein [Sulfobacillus harzensis]NMP24460.1 hypothetical protein [Sulfobacillus harzensis]
MNQVTVPRKGGRPAGAKRTESLSMQLTPVEARILRRAAELESLGPSLIARAGALQRARQILAEAGENA